MGLNAFFAYTLIINGGIPWPVALGIIFWAGVLFLLVSATPLRERIAMAIPPSLRAATAAGIGLLLTFIGLQNSGFVAANPATMVGVGALDHRAILTLAALVVSVWLARRNNPFAYLAGIALVTAVAWTARLRHAAGARGSARRISRRCSSSSTSWARCNWRWCRRSSR